VDVEQRQRQGVVAVNLGLGANIVLAALKTTIGILGHSPALLADGVNSTSDVAYYVVVSIFMRLARKPADEEHPFGHSQLESIAALLVGSFVITTAIAIFWDAVNNVYDLWSGGGDYKGAEVGALIMALLTVTIKIFLTTYTSRIGKKTDNPAVMALAYDHRNDIFSASGAALGIFLGRLGVFWGDPLAGALVALVILRTGLHIVRESSEDLMDAVPSQALARRIQNLLEGRDGVRQVEEVHAHRFGPYLLVNLTIGVDGSLSVAEGDRIATRAEATLMKNIEFVGRVHVHYHPANHNTPSDLNDPLPKHKLTLNGEGEAVPGEEPTDALAGQKNISKK
jgi:cation diffusion facilitator family transporter